MSLFDGVVSLDDDQVPVIVGLEDDSMRISSGGAEIGQWADGEYDISERGDGEFTITAESETLRFFPTDPGLFAAGLRGESVVAQPEPTEPTAVTAVATSDEGDEPDIQIEEGPEPRPLTRIIFYATAGVTVALGLWALVSVFVL